MRNRFLFIVVTVCIIITIIFLWQESNDFTFAKKINDDKIANYAVSIGVLLTGVSAVLLYSQLRENERQWVINRQPIFVIKNYIFFTDDHINLNSPLPVPMFFSDAACTKVIIPSIELRNVGLGPAQNITIDWQYNIEDVNNIINGHYQEQIPRDGTTLIHALPFNETIALSIPSHYLLSLGRNVNITLADLALENPPDDKKSDIILRISYGDFANNRHTKSYTISVVAQETIIYIQQV